jgi:hypothetical protein
MAQNRDAVLLMTGKTSLIEETQQRYIDALEKRISFLESQARNAKQVYHTTAICKPIIANCTLFPNQASGYCGLNYRPRSYVV